MTAKRYQIEVLPPPGLIVAPNGFPADPRPPGAPRIFLDAMEVRIAVFCVEQHCAVEPELDEDDPKSWHWVAYEVDEGDSPTRTAVSVIRIVAPPHGAHPNGFHDPNEEAYVKLGRVATLKQARGKGLSRKLTEAACQWLAQHAPEVGPEWKGLVLTHAQLDVEKMYNKLGFVTDGRLGQWDEEGIQHVGMWKRVEIQGSG